MADIKINFNADGDELVNLAKKMGDEYRAFLSQITILENELIPAISKSWNGPAGQSYVLELMHDLSVLKGYKESLEGLIASVMVAGNHYVSAEESALQHVAKL